MQRLIVDVLVIRHQVIAHDAQVTAHQLADYLAHGEHDPAEQDQALAQREDAPLDLQAPRHAVEQPVLHAVIQALDRLGLAIDDVVQ